MAQPPAPSSARAPLFAHHHPPTGPLLAVALGSPGACPQSFQLIFDYPDGIYCKGLIRGKGCLSLSRPLSCPFRSRSSLEWPTGLSPDDSVESAKSLSLLPPMSRASRPAGQRSFKFGIDGRPVYCKLFAFGSSSPLIYYETALDRPSLDPGDSRFFPNFYPIRPCRYRYRIRRQGL